MQITHRSLLRIRMWAQETASRLPVQLQLLFTIGIIFRIRCTYKCDLLTISRGKSCLIAQNAVDNRRYEISGFRPRSLPPSHLFFLFIAPDPEHKLRKRGDNGERERRDGCQRNRRACNQRYHDKKKILWRIYHIEYCEVSLWKMLLRFLSTSCWNIGKVRGRVSQW